MSAPLAQILVATDGSPIGDRVVAYAIALAREHGSALLVCTVVDYDGTTIDNSTYLGGFASSLPLLEIAEDTAKATVSTAAERATEAGVPVITSVLHGRSARAIVSFANERQVDAIVMGAQGSTALERAFFGSTVEGVLRHATVPTFVVPPDTYETSFDRILVAIDDSDPSDAAATFSVELARGSSTQLILCTAIETDDLRSKAARHGYDPVELVKSLRAIAKAILTTTSDRARAAGIPVDITISEGDPVDTILKAAELHNVDAIVVGTHGRRGLRRFLIGSVAEAVVRRSPVPVFVSPAASHRSGHPFTWPIPENDVIPMLP